MVTKGANLSYLTVDFETGNRESDKLSGWVSLVRAVSNPIFTEKRGRDESSHSLRRERNENERNHQ